MPAYWQIATARAVDAAYGALSGAFALLRDTNKRARARFDSELDDNDDLKDKLDALGSIRQYTDGRIQRWTEKTLALCKRINASRAALAKPLDPILIKGRTRASTDATYNSLATLKKALAEKTSAFTGARHTVRNQAAVLDRLNKRWFKAWGSEFDSGSNELAALADVDTEENSPAPSILEIQEIAPQGLSPKVTFVPGTGKHATVKDLLWKIQGVNVDFKRIPADVQSGNVLGPFTAGQVVVVCTDVGNSRDNSELSPERTLTIQAAA